MYYESFRKQEIIINFLEMLSNYFILWCYTDNLLYMFLNFSGLIYKKFLRKAFG